jgi:hypothetical protein
MSPEEIAGSARDKTRSSSCNENPNKEHFVTQFLDSVWDQIDSPEPVGLIHGVSHDDEVINLRRDPQKRTPSRPAPGAPEDRH